MPVVTSHTLSAATTATATPTAAAAATSHARHKHSSSSSSNNSTAGGLPGASAPFFPLPPGAVLPNWFDDEPDLLLKRAAVWSIACVRGRDGTVPAAVTAFITGALRARQFLKMEHKCSHYYTSCVCSSSTMQAPAVHHSVLCG